MLKIGDFSRLSQVSVKTLRYYDEIGLLRPGQIDRFTGYRYYSADQLARLNRILALKDLGLSLEQIGQLLRGDLPPEQIRGMLKLRQAEIQQNLEEAQAQLARVEARLRQIEQENTMPHYDIALKHVESQLVASVRDVVPTYPDTGRLYGEIFGHLGRTGAGDLICAAVWHDEGVKERDVDAEAIVFLKSPVPDSERVKVYELPAATMASVIHKGAYNAFNQAYEAVLKWIDANGYKIVGPPREIYLYCSDPVRQDDESYVTEIQFPVEKA
jgi:effector-binding domain-containing protein